MRIRILIHVLLALLGVLAAPPACARGTATDSAQGESTSPPGTKARQASAQQSDCQRSAARTAVGNAIGSLAKIRADLDKLRSAVDEAVPFQIERCERISAGGETDDPERDWKILEQDALTNALNIISSSGLVIGAIRAKAITLVRYVPDFAEEEGKSLKQAIALLRKAADAYDNAFKANIGAAQEVRKRNCATAVEERGKSDPYFKDGDEAWLMALKILEALAQAQPGGEPCGPGGWKCRVRCAQIDLKTGSAVGYVESDGFGPTEKDAFYDGQKQLQKTSRPGVPIKQCHLVGRCEKQSVR